MLVINGRNENEFIGKTAKEFIKSKKYDKGKIAVELNGEILPKDKFNVVFKDGDRAEIVHLVGGG